MGITMADAKSRKSKKPPKDEAYEKLSKDLSVDAEELELLEDGTFPSWPTGCATVDILTGIGGLPQGRVVEIFGRYSSGKSNLFLTTAAEVQKLGKKVVLLDFERTFDPNWARTLGVDVADKSSFLWIRSNALRTVEDGFDILYRILDSADAPDIGLVIWDSLAGSTTAAIADKNSVGDSARMASRAGLLSDELPKLSEKLKSKNLPTTVGFVNQVRDNLSPMGRSDVTPGGRAFQHGASMRLQIQELKKETKTVVDEFTLSKVIEPIGQRIRITVEKTKHGQRGRKAEALFTYQNGFDNVGILVEFACARGDFNKISAQKFEVPAEFNVDGKPFEGTDAKIRQHFYESSESYDLLVKEMTNRINASYWEKIKSFSFKNMDEDIILDEPNSGSNTLDLEAGGE